jgi:H+/Cl- antiporter ClcA
MLPLEKRWYQKLLVLALVLGVAGGVWALIFMGIINMGIGFFFGDSGTDWWTGKWWWIPLTALGGLIVAVLRKIWKIQPKVPGAVELARQGWIDTRTAPYWVAVSVISLITGASLGPSFGLVVMAGAFGSWLMTRLGITDEEAKQEYTLTGMASGLGGAFAAPPVCDHPGFRTLTDFEAELPGRIHPRTFRGNRRIHHFLWGDRECDIKFLSPSGV